MLNLALAAMLASLTTFLAPSGKINTCYPPQPAPQTDSSQIRASFHTLLRNKLHTSNAIVTSDVIDSLNLLIDKGAGTLSRQNATPEQIKQASNSLSSFIDNLISNGEPTRGPRKEVLVNVKSYKRSKKGICPLFPFC